MSDNTNIVISAASYAAEEFKNSVSSIRNISAVAGRVMAVPGVTQEVVTAAWLYKLVDAGTTDEEQQKALAKLEARFDRDVIAILKAICIKRTASKKEIEEGFKASDARAKLIRVCETIVGLSDVYKELSSGNSTRLEDTKRLLNLAQFIYNSVDNKEPGALFAELKQLIHATSAIWNAVASTVNVFENTLGLNMTRVKAIVVCNDAGTVGVVTLKPDASLSDARYVVDEAKKKIGGSIFTESVIYATVPVPKASSVTSVPVPSAA